jgi:hypothetical protein
VVATLSEYSSLRQILGDIRITAYINNDSAPPQRSLGRATGSRREDRDVVTLSKVLF